ncbi:Sarcospan [Caenorhabditis elegans]|uniref:Sarcospan n=1 Tax=Caenorhabditis elegans TaxID=6239 RepID=D3KFS3_CAEEL|nr:Sarcospan [Caenorhabditis elegans]CBJ25075.1 Sarcospan [Caenorhabditis elegans]|eukprot:NP_001254190.1 Uncharacterized protein CELE_F44G4.6 [Caenorhabditis elegans]
MQEGYSNLGRCLSIIHFLCGFFILMSGVGSNYLSHDPFSMSFAFIYILVSLICCVTTRNYDPLCLRMCAFLSFVMTVASAYLVYQHASQTEQVCLRKCVRTEDYFHTQLAIICGIQVLNCVISIVYSCLCLKKSPKNQAYDCVKMEPEELPVTV